MKWSTQRKHIKAQGGRSDGLYNALPKAVLTDSPGIGTEREEAIRDYINGYRTKHGRFPSTTHLNKQFCIRATKQYYRDLVL